MKNLVLLILFTFVLSNFSFAQVETKNYDFKNFTKVKAGSSINLIIKQGDNFSIESKAEKEIYSKLRVEKQGDELKIYLTGNNFNFKMKEPVIFRISMPDLEEIDLSGGSYAHIEMDLPKQDFSADLSGGCELEGKVNYADMNISLSGGCKTKLNGTAQDLKLEGSGGTVFNLKDLKAKNIDADLSGGVSAKVNLSGKLNADLSGGCKIEYYGNPTSVSSNSSGSSKISRGEG